MNKVNIVFEQIVVFVVSALLFVAPIVSMTSANEASAQYRVNLKLEKENPFALVENQSRRVSFQVVESQFEKERKAQQAKITQRQVVARGEPTVRVSAADPDLATKRALAQKAASAYGIPWEILEAVWQVESGKRMQTSVRSYAGAQGPLQFVRGTWKNNQVDGNGDGMADINNAEDALYGAAKLLAANGAASGNIDKALLAYNHAYWYVNKVKRLANEIGWNGQ